MTDKKFTPFGTLLLKLCPKRPKNLRHPTRGCCGHLRTIAILLTHPDPKRAGALVDLCIRQHGVNHGESFRPAESILPADLIAIAKHGYTIIDISRNQRRVWLQAFSQKELLGGLR